MKIIFLIACATNFITLDQHILSLLDLRLLIVDGCRLTVGAVRSKFKQLRANSFRSNRTRRKRIELIRLRFEVLILLESDLFQIDVK